MKFYRGSFTVFESRGVGVLFQYEITLETRKVILFCIFETCDKYRKIPSHSAYNICITY